MQSESGRSRHPISGIVREEAAQNGITTQLSGLMGQQTADVLQSAIASAAGKKAGTLATAHQISSLTLKGLKAGAPRIAPSPSLSADLLWKLPLVF
jgi:hypothetical protein